MVEAHGIGGRTDQPFPIPIVVAAGAAVIVVTFVALALAWKSPRFQGGPVYRPGGARLALGPVLGAAGLVALILVIAQMLLPIIGLERSTLRPGIAPVTVWVLFRLVVPFAGAVIGDWYTDLDPWRTLSRLFQLGEAERPGLLRRLGVVPAAVALSAFAWLELVYPTPGDPTTLGAAALVFTVALLAAITLVGLETGSTVFDPFTIYNRLISAISPLGRNPDGGVVWRGWLRSLAVVPEWPGLWLFIVVTIGTVTFDGLSAAPWWHASTMGLSNTVGGRTVLLVTVVAALALTYRAVCSAVARLAGGGWSGRAIAHGFAHTLVPIALAYAIAHYFTLVLFEGQQVIAAASDPFGLGWDLFGTADRRVERFLTSSDAVWLLQTGFIVAGHVVGVVLAYDRSLRDFGRGAVRPQFAMLALMIALTSLGLMVLTG